MSLDEYANLIKQLALLGELDEGRNYSWALKRHKTFGQPRELSETTSTWTFEYEVEPKKRNKISPFFLDPDATAIALFPFKNPHKYQIRPIPSQGSFFFGTVVTLCVGNPVPHRQDILRINHELPHLRAEYDLMPDGTWISKLPI